MPPWNSPLSSDPRLRPPPGGFKPGVSVETFARQGNMLPDPLVSGSDELQVMHSIMGVVTLCLLLLSAPPLLFCCAHRRARTLRKRMKALACEVSSAPPPASETPSRTAPFFNPEKLSLSFDRISYWAPAAWTLSRRGQQAPRQLLRDVSGVFRSGAVTAIMGPSGSGKTTLLNLLSGRAKSGSFSGERSLNGAAFERGLYERKMRMQGYVLQEDAFFESLTVLEQALFACALKMPHSLPIEQRFECVTSMLVEMELVAIAHNKVGGTTFKGISGGQRRRLSVAMELLGEPSILFLDEPTSGLDGKASLTLVELLSRIASRGRTLTTTIHQPRAEIMCLFDSLLLLTGGQLAYFGPASGAVGFFVSAGCGSIHPSDNPGDYLIDAIGLHHEGSGRTSTRVDSSELPSRFMESEAYRLLQAELHEPPDASGAGGSGAREHRAYETTIWQQTWVLLARRGTRVAASACVLEVLQVMAVGIALSLAFAHSTTSEVFSKPIRDMEWLVCSVTYLFVQQYMSVLPELLEDRPILLKEHEGGTVRLSAYILYTNLADVPRAFCHVAVMFAIGYRWVGLNPVPPHMHFILATAWAGTSSFQALVCAVAFLTDKGGVVYTLLFMLVGIGSLFGGLMVTWSNIVPPLRWCYYAGLNSFTVRSIVLVNSLANPYYQYQCSELTNSSLGVMAQVPQLNPLAHTIDPHLACIEVMRSINTTHAAKGDLDGLGSATDPDDATVDIGPMALALYGFNDAFTATTAVILTGSAVGFRFVALFLAILRTRLSRKLAVREEANTEEVPRQSQRNQIERWRLLGSGPRSNQ
ncbi:MAG: hypothetical protein SGPRY_001386, partial [Prymnesium sp.]